MAVEEDFVEVKFRLADGTDIGPNKYSPNITVGSLKEKLIADWLKDRENCPRSMSDVKLINAGKILENNRKIAESSIPFNEVPGGVITMHVVMRAPLSAKKREKLQDDSQKKGGCSCTIM